MTTSFPDDQKLISEPALNRRDGGLSGGIASGLLRGGVGIGGGRLRVQGHLQVLGSGVIGFRRISRGDGILDGLRDHVTNPIEEEVN